jgi:hypothetical protein
MTLNNLTNDNISNLSISNGKLSIESLVDQTLLKIEVFTMTSVFVLGL